MNNNNSLSLVEYSLLAAQKTFALAEIVTLFAKGSLNLLEITSSQVW